MKKKLKTENYINEIIEIIKTEKNNSKNLENLLSKYHNRDIAEAIVHIDLLYRKKLYRALDIDRLSEVFEYIEKPDKFLNEMSVRKAAMIVSNIEPNIAKDVLTNINEEKRKKIIKLMEPESTEDLKLLLSYSDEEIGSEMSTDFIVINNKIDVRGAMKELRKQANDKKDNISTIYVVDDKGCYYGTIDLKDLIKADKNDNIEDIISKSYPYIRDKDIIMESIERIKSYAEDSIPVLNDDDKIVGIIVAQDILELIDEEFGEDYVKFAGLIGEEDLKEKLCDSMKKRLPWLIILLFFGLIISAVVGLFEKPILRKLSIIMCFQSLILDMAGNVGTQSLAVTIRLLTDEALSTKKKIKLILKEIKVGFINGLLIGVSSLLFISLYLFTSKGKSFHIALLISLCVCISLIISMTISSLIGTLTPLFFHKIKIDPAVASGPLITTLNDLVAIIAYYGISLFLLIKMFKIHQM